MLVVPYNFYILAEFSRDETCIRKYLNWNGRGCKYVKSNCTIFAWIRNLKLAKQISIQVLKLQLFTRLYINKVRSNIDCRNKSILVGSVKTFITWFLTRCIFLSVLIQHFLLIFHHSCHFMLKSIHCICLFINLGCVCHLLF